ncbi:MAG: tyrosine-type recombinase/integrase [Gemmatimonadota bacterium]|nr:tyrosine-type recombinase/integrase [Gemmatimonadota bacterium]
MHERQCPRTQRGAHAPGLRRALGNATGAEGSVAEHQETGLRRLKTRGSARDVPIPDPLAELLAAHRVRLPGGPPDPVFPGPLSDYRAARRLFRRACLAAQLHDGGRNPTGVPKPNATIHDLRHTYGVHCAEAGVPIVRLQKLFGQASPHMTPVHESRP